MGTKQEAGAETDRAAKRRSREQISTDNAYKAVCRLPPDELVDFGNRFAREKPRSAAIMAEEIQRTVSTASRPV